MPKLHMPKWRSNSRHTVRYGFYFSIWYTLMHYGLDGRTVVVLTNFTIVPNVKACWKKNSSNDRSKYAFLNVAPPRCPDLTSFFSNHMQISNNSKIRQNYQCDYIRR